MTGWLSRWMAALPLDPGTIWWTQPGGASRDRTGDLLVANQTLSQLSYGPLVYGRESSRRLLDERGADIASWTAGNAEDG